MIVHLDGFDKKEIKILFNSLRGKTFQKMKQVELVKFCILSVLPKTRQCMEYLLCVRTYLIIGPLIYSHADRGVKELSTVRLWNYNPGCFMLNLVAFP